MVVISVSPFRGPGGPFTRASNGPGVDRLSAGPNSVAKVSTHLERRAQGLSEGWRMKRTVDREPAVSGDVEQVVPNPRREPPAAQSDVGEHWQAEPTLRMASAKRIAISESRAPIHGQN